MALWWCAGVWLVRIGSSEKLNFVFEVIRVKLIKRKNVLGRGNSKYKGFKVGMNLCMTEEPRESRCGWSTAGEKADAAMKCEVSASVCV